MTDKEILKQVIQKAVDNGCGFADQYLTHIKEGKYDFNPKTVCRILCFRNDFAKAFWKWESMAKRESGAVDEGEQEAWKDHLQQMVIEENPIQYLKKFL